MNAITPTVACTMHRCMATWWLDSSTTAHARITFEVITFEPLRVVRTDFTGFQWQHRAAHHEELIALKAYRPLRLLLFRRGRGNTHRHTHRTKSNSSHDPTNQMDRSLRRSKRHRARIHDIDTPTVALSRRCSVAGLSHGLGSKHRLGRPATQYVVWRRVGGQWQAQASHPRMPCQPRRSHGLCRRIDDFKFSLERFMHFGVPQHLFPMLNCSPSV